MITDTEYMQLISETYDLSDYTTKKKLLFCNEAQRIVNVEHIVNNLYLHIKNNVSGIDFGTIPKSKGVVTQIENYASIVDCINSVHELVASYGERTDIPDALTTALANLQKRERMFTRAFATGIEFPVMLYNMTVLAVVSSTSLLLSGSVEYVKNGHDSFSASFDKAGYVKSRDHVLYQYITLFNKNCDNGSIDKLINECIRNNLTAVSESYEYEDGEEYLEEGIVGTAVAAAKVAKKIASSDAVKNSKVMGTAKRTVNIGKKVVTSKPVKIVAIIVAIGIAAVLLLKGLCKLMYWAISTCSKLSDWFEIQATYLQINAENLKYRDDRKGSDDHRKKVYQSQMKWVDRFKKISNKLALKDSKATKETEEEERRNRNSHYDEDDDYYDDEDDDSLF